jgi:hypothetical protein
MALAWLALRAQLRQRWRAMGGLALLLGLAGGVVLTAVAGAWRTDTAYPRLLSWANAAQVQVVAGAPAPAYLAALARLPQVAQVAPENQYTLALPVAHGAPDFRVQAWSSPDGSYGQAVDRVKITAGRMLSAGAAGEAVIDPRLAAMERLRPGDTLRLLGVPDNAQGDPDVSLAFPVSVRVAGIGVFDNQVVPVTAADSEPMVLLSPAFARTKAAGSVLYLAQAGVRLRQGASPAAFIAAAKALEQKYPQAHPNHSAFANLTDQVTATERAMRPEAVALGVFAALAGLIALAVTGQLLRRGARRRARGHRARAAAAARAARLAGRRRRRDLAVLKSLGLTRAQLQGAVAWEATTLAAAALLVGVPTGIAAGRLAWAAFATGAGVAAGATFDLTLVLATIPVTLLLANVIAAWPGQAAARLRPAVVLRAE